MLFQYYYVNHSIERMQEFIDYIFNEVWCKAPNSDYDISLFDGNQPLKEIILSLHFSEPDNIPKGAMFFVEGLQLVFLDFKNYSLAQINQLKEWYLSNNNIEELCRKNPAVLPITYTDLDAFDSTLKVHLKSFFESLYSSDFLRLKAVQEAVGIVDDHYNLFMKTNTLGKCPFCGLNDIKGQYHTKREAYDHLIPKALYPFNSINFKNLAPLCNECNSSYKLAKDPLHNSVGERRKVFYIYNPLENRITISISINTNDILNLCPENIDIACGPALFAEEISTWNDLFGIEERYKAKCCSADAKYWIMQITEESQNYGLTPREFLTGKLRDAERNPFSDSNFLRKPFLEACESQGVFR